MLNPDELEISKLRDKLREVEREYAQAMRARGFDPAQDENLALPSALAKLYQEREDLRTKIAALAVNGAGG